ncbi:MAG: TonB-dependent receptor [Bacteroidales bacterium]|nr:TonB-dependent receptor [Bacteroidales bacterium]
MKKLIIIFSLILGASGYGLAQVIITGKVTDNNDDPLPGVTVMLKGTQRGTLTGEDGSYSLGNVSKEDIIVFSFVGMLSEEIAVGEQTVINTSLTPDITQLDEVVIVGYGDIKRANLTGAVVDMKAEELEDIPVGDLSAALDGKLAGVKISSSTGKPGEASVLTIRTTSSYGRVTEDVLYVIDGVISDATTFNLLDASEVESISVLKDAAAAVYGTRSAGGVVLVKTKRGKEGKPRFQYSGSYGIAQATKFPEMLSGPELATMYNDVLDIYKDYGRVTTYDYFTEDEIAYFDSISGYNWIDELIKPATTEKHTLNISGGGERISYFVGGSYYKENGMTDMLNYSRYTLRTNLEANITKNLRASLGLNYSYHDKLEPNFATDNSGVLREIYKQALTAPPWVPVSIDGLPVNNYVSSNPLALFQSGSYKNSYGNSTGIRAEIQYQIPFIEGLTLGFQYSRSEQNGRGKEYAQDFICYNFETTGTHRHIITEEIKASDPFEPHSNEEGLYESTDYGKNYQLNASLRYSKKLKAHDIAALLVYEQSETHTNRFTTKIRQSAAIDGYDYMWAFTSDDIWENGSGATESGNLGFIGRLNYGYAEKYLLEATFRYEASQKFHPDNRWGFFPAVSAGWVTSEENFFKNNISFINFLKFRHSFGIVGNDNLPNAFTWTPTFTGDATGAIIGDQLTSAIEARNGLVYIPSVHWQETNSYNIGMDMRFWRNQIRTSVDYYYRHTYGVFNRRTNIPAIVGLSSDQRPPEENYGEASATGVEFELGYDGKTGNLGYSVDAIFSWDRTRELKMFQNPAVEGSWKDDRYNDPSNQPGYIALGIMRTQEQLNDWMAKYPDYTIDDGGIERPLELGMIYYKDIRGEEYIDSITGKIAYLPPDGKITDADVTIIAKYTNPPYHYGFTLGLSWKGFKITGVFTGVFGHKVFISKDEQTTPDPTLEEINNVFSFWGDYWTEDNPDAEYPRPYAYGLAEQNTTFWMRDGHTLQLSTLNLSYNLPSHLSQKIKIPELRIYFTSRNLWTIINPFDHKDPSVSRGYDYPLMRTFNLGINITL